MGAKVGNEEKLLEILAPLISEIKTLRKRLGEVEERPLPDNLKFSQEQLNLLEQWVEKSSEGLQDDFNERISNIQTQLSDLTKPIDGLKQHVETLIQEVDVRDEVAILDEKLENAAKSITEEFSQRVGNLIDEIEHLHGKLNTLPSQTEIGDRVIDFLKQSREEDMREVKRILEIS